MEVCRLVVETAFDMNRHISSFILLCKLTLQLCSAIAHYKYCYNALEIYALSKVLPKSLLRGGDLFVLPPNQLTCSCSLG